MSEPHQAGAPPSDGSEVVRTAARAFERDRYLSALLAPAAARDGLLTLAALAGELERIRAFVSTPLLGEIRLQWWRDALDAGVAEGNAPSGHPIADAWLPAMRRHHLAGELVHDIIEAQVRRLDDRPFADLEALCANVVAWDGALFQLAWRILGGTGTAPAILEAAGEAYGLARLLIEAPAELAQGRALLPVAELDAARGSPPSPAWRAAHALISQRAQLRLAQIARDYPMADRRVRLATLPVALVRPYLRLSQRVDIAALEAQDISPLARVWRLWLTSRTGRV